MAYAVGCNPDVDAFDDWWELARAEFGGDDFGEFFDLAGTGVRRHPAQRRPRSVGHGHASVDAAHARCAGRSLIVLLPSPLTGASLYLVARLRAASHALVSSPTRAAHAGTVPSRRIIGVVIVGCPVARNLDDGWTLEVTGVDRWRGQRLQQALRGPPAARHARWATRASSPTRCRPRAAPACGWPAGAWSDGGNWNRARRPRH